VRRIYEVLAEGVDEGVHISGADTSTRGYSGRRRHSSFSSFQHQGGTPRGGYEESAPLVTTSSARADVLTVRTDEDADPLTIEAAGELDIATAPTLEESLRDAFEGDASSIVLDLDQVRFIDSMGLRVLLWAAAHSRENAHRLQIRCGSRAVRRVMGVTATEDRLPLNA
jgi:anti-sigma B factor antagonist